MAKLVVLSAGLVGRTHELTVDKTTIGRVEDNSFQIAEPSISSHHCEILLNGNQVTVKDLNSTNGTFINGEKVSEAVLKPGQTLRLGQIELKLDDGTGAAPAPAAAAAAPAPAAPATSTRKNFDQTQRGVSLNELEQGARTAGFDTTRTDFSKKTNKTNKLFLIAGIAAAVIIVIGLFYAYIRIKQH
ncbi:MAG: FHA domain-containing protein [Verrucomicrobiota bacterium]